MKTSHIFIIAISAQCIGLKDSLGSQIPINKIDGERAKSYITVLAADSLEGRRTGLPGGEKAAQYVASKFREFGLKPGVGDTSYFQSFTIAAPIEHLPMNFCLLPDSSHPDTVQFNYGADFVSFAYGGKGKVISSVVFISYGIHEPTKGRDDLEKANLKGKIALALRGVPPDDGEEYWDEQNYNGYRSSHACDAGAIGFLQVLGDEALQGTIGENNFRADLPAFWISKKTCNQILSSTRLTLDSLFALANAHPTGYSMEIPIQVLLEATAGVIPDASGSNVLAYLPGSDPRLSSEMVLLGAHMDHLGIDALGRVYNGAEDNASGTALLLEIACVLANDPLPPRRSVYFCAFAGEELNLVGSTQFVKYPPVALDSIVAVINMDMVGEGGQGISLGGSPNFPQIWNIWEKALPDSEQKRIVHFKPGHNSDHAPFEEAGIPAFSTFARGEHFHYHNPLDDVDLIQTEVLQEVGEVNYQGMRALADYPISLMDSQRYTRYLFQSAETVALGAAPLPLITSDDSPDLILYEVGKLIAPSDRHRLRKLMVEIDHLETQLKELSAESAVCANDFKDIPSGRREPGVVLGLASPALAEAEPAVYDVLRRLNLLFIHVPLSQKQVYFGARGLKKEGRELVQQLQGAPQMVIWDVPSFKEAGFLLNADIKPSVIRIASNYGFSVNDTALYGKSNSFFLLSVCPAIYLRSFSDLCGTCLWNNIGVDAPSCDSTLNIIKTWSDAGFTPLRMRGLLGENLIRFLKKHREFKRPIVQEIR